MKKYQLISKLDNGYSQVLYESSSYIEILHQYLKWVKIKGDNKDIDIFVKIG